MKMFHKILAALMVFTMLFGSVPAWATGTDIVINTVGTVSPSTYSDMSYAGVSGTTKSQTLDSNVNSIKTSGEATSTVYGIYVCGSYGVTADSLAGGIAVNSTGGNAFGIRAEGSGTTTVTGLGGITANTTSAEAFGIYSYGSDADNFKNNVTFSGSGSYINATNGAEYCVYGIYSYGSGTTTVNGLDRITVKGVSGTLGINAAGGTTTVNFNGNSTISATCTGDAEACGIKTDGTDNATVTDLTVTGLQNIIAAGTGGSAHGIRTAGSSAATVHFSGTKPTITLTSTNSSVDGIYTFDTSTVTVTGLDSITGTATATYSTAVGIGGGGNESVTFDPNGTGAITLNGGNNMYVVGIDLEGGANPTTVSVENIGTIGVTSNVLSAGVWSIANDKTTTLTFKENSRIKATDNGNTGVNPLNLYGAYGIFMGAYSGDTGTTTITGLGGIEASATNSSGTRAAYGIYTNGTAAGFELNTTFSGAGSYINATSANSSAYGIYAQGTGKTIVKELGGITASGSKLANGIYACGSDADFKTNVSFKGNGGQAITATGTTAYSIYTAGAGATTVNFEDSILSGKIKQEDTSTLTLNFNNGGVWTPAADDIIIADGAAGTITANVENGGTIDFKQTLTLPSATTINLNSGSTVAFHLDNVAVDTTIVDSTANPIDITNTGVKLYHNSNSALYAEGKGVTLISGAKGSYTKQEITARKEDETISAYKYTVELSGDKLTAIYGGETTSEESKSYSEGRLGGASALTTASDLLAGAGMATAVAAAQESAGGMAAYAEISGAHSRFTTGSHVDMNSLNIVAGLAKKLNDKFTLGAYIEGGNSRYASYNEFASGELRADGDINYFGAGLLGKYEFNKTERGNGYIDAAFGAGHTNQDYHTESAALNSARYDAGSAYLKAHATVGYQWNLEKGKLDGYAKYLWAHQNGDSPTLSTGEVVNFDAINSHRLRIGARYSQAIKKSLGWYGGLAYEYEFDMKAGANSQGYAIAEPDLKGGSGMAELGLKFAPENAKGWKFDAGLQGFTGKRDSLGVRLGAWYEF